MSGKYREMCSFLLDGCRWRKSCLGLVPSREGCCLQIVDPFDHPGSEEEAGVGPTENKPNHSSKKD